MRFTEFENRSTTNLLHVYFDFEFPYEYNCLVQSLDLLQPVILDFIFNLWKVSYFSNTGHLKFLGVIEWYIVAWCLYKFFAYFHNKVNAEATLSLLIYLTYFTFFYYYFFFWHFEGWIWIRNIWFFEREKWGFSIRSHVCMQVLV